MRRKIKGVNIRGSDKGFGLLTNSIVTCLRFNTIDD